MRCVTSSPFRHNHRPGRLGIGLDKSPELGARATDGISSDNPRCEHIAQAREKTSTTVTASDFPGILNSPTNPERYSRAPVKQLRNFSCSADAVGLVQSNYP